MTCIIKLSLAKSWGIEDIDTAVKAFADEVRAWNYRNTMVKETESCENEAERWTSCPAPNTNPMIMNAVDADGNIDYVIEDDMQTLRDAEFAQKKNVLFQYITNAEAFERAKIVPPGKERLWLMQEEDIQIKDAKVVQAETKKKKTIDPLKLRDIVIKKRTAEDKRHMIAQDKRRETLRKIARWAAEQHADIEDLTIDTIDAWQMVPFSI